MPYHQMDTHNTTLIKTIALVKKFGDKAAVNGVQLEVNGGEIFGFLGPNGAGKTTTIKMICGLLRPTAGTALVGGFDIQQQSIQAKSILGYVPDEPMLYDKLSAREFLGFVADLYNVPVMQAGHRAEELLKLFDLAGDADNLIEGFSHGMRQKTAIAGALMHDPKVLVLDEPTVGLDPKSARLIKDILRQLAERGAAVFLSTHILEIAERMCDRIGIIDHGNLIAVGTVDELRAGQSGQSLEDIFLSLTGGAEYAEIAQVLA
jgi:ABC-2 type transport system ATP-binding protein